MPTYTMNARTSLVDAMYASPLSLVVLSGLLALVAVVGVHLATRAKYTRLPPGPTPRLLQGTPLPELYPWRHFYTLSKTYGPVLTIWDGTTPAVVCNSVSSAEYLLEKRAQETADRPRAIAGNYLSHGKRLLLVGHSAHWRRLRRAIHQPLQPQSVRELRDYQERLAHGVVLDIMRDPAHFQDHILTYTASLVVHMAYGRTDRAHYSDPDIALQVLGGHRLGVTLRPGAFKVEAYPWLQYMPGYMRTLVEWASDELNLYRSNLASTRARMKEPGAVAPCFATYLIENQAKLELDDDDLAYLLGSVFGAGSDTSSSAITIAVMASAVYPEAAARVRAELDERFGTGTPDARAPTFAELEEGLPVLRAFINETFRWRPVSSGGFQHRTTADIEYDGYLVPKGTTISGNHWAIHRDEDYYGPNIDDFVIDRWLGPDGDLKPNMRTYQFGFGRRICPGQHVAKNSVLINTANLLWAFDIAKARDGKGDEIDIDTLAFTNAANSHPLPFKVQFTPRHKNLEALITETM